MGFAKLAREDPDRMHEIASKGGKAAQESLHNMSGQKKDRE
jgi:general stress protein YciG